MTREKLVIGAVLLAYALIPAFAPENIVHLMTITGIWIIIASGLNLLTGYMGYVSFGHAGFVGIGAYTSALLTLKFGMSFWAGALVASLFTALFGLLLGVAILRLSGIYFSIGTLILGEILYSIYYNWSPVTGGFMGLNVPPPELALPIMGGISFELLQWYYFVYLLVFLVVGGLKLLIDSHFGKEIIAIRENESLSQSLGVNINQRKSQCLAISCFLAGMGGALFGAFMGHVDPDSFSIAGSTEFITIIIIGGLASLMGPFFGAYVLITLSLYLEMLGKWRMVVYGLIIVFVMIYARGGIVGFLEMIFKREFRK